MTVCVAAFDDELEPASRLADALGARLRLIGLRHFPDGESLVEAPTGFERVILYRSLDRPDAKIVPLLLAVDALRRSGTRRLVLAAPYLAYLRQDAVFAAGQPLSRDVIAGLLGARFDRIVTVAPHLHRTADLSAVCGVPVSVLSPADALCGALPRLLSLPPGTLFVGPDRESRTWAAELARRLGGEAVALRKDRRGDRDVSLSADHASFAGRRVVLVDDVCSSGATLAAAATLVREGGAVSVDAVVVHALFDVSARRELHAAGIERLVWTDSCAHAGAAINLASALAEALAEERSQ